MKKILLALVLAISLSGCLLVPFINAYNEMGWSPESRKELLSKSLKRYSNSLSSQNIQDLANFITADKRYELARGFVDPNTKMVDGRINFIDFDSDAKKANIDFVVRYYQIPFYVVKERTEKLTWEFEGSDDGWKIHDRKVQDN